MLEFSALSQTISCSEPKRFKSNTIDDPTTVKLSPLRGENVVTYHFDNFDDTREGDKVSGIELESFSHARVNCSRPDGEGS